LTAAATAAAVSCGRRGGPAPSSAGRHELAHPDGQLDHAVVPAGELGQPGMVDAEHPPRCPAAPAAAAFGQPQQRGRGGAHRGGGGPGGGRRQPARGDGAPGFPGHGGDHVHDLEQLHHVRHVAEEHHQADRHQRRRDDDRAGGGPAAVAVADDQRGDRVGERGELRAERHPGDG
jgi:hypothetical protein